MNYFLIQALLIAGIGDEESTFWTQILVFLFVAVSWGVYSLVKNRQNEFKDRRQDLAEETSTHYTKPRWQFQLPRKHIALCKDVAQKYITKAQGTRLHIPFDSPDTTSQEMPENKPATEKNKDLHSGMELLELDFLLSIVENTKGNGRNDVTMRKLNFNELLRRNKLNQINSKAVKVYAINQGNLYGKDIQCEAIRELAERTTHNSDHNLLQPALV